MRWLRQLRSLFRKGKRDAEMTEEMRHHVEMQSELNVKAGMNPEEARYAALRQFGNVGTIQERAREARGWVWLEQFGKDLRYAARSLRRSPSFAVTAVLTLALGIGVNTALFSVYNTIALRSLPVKDPEMLVKVNGQGPWRYGYYPTWSYPDYLELRDGNQTLSDLAAVWPIAVPVDDGSPLVADPAFDVRDAGTMLVQNVSGNYFQALGADFALGRGFLPEENRAPGDGYVIVLSHLFWTTRLHHNPAVLGSTVRLHNRPYTVIGVTAEGFAGDQPAPPVGWVPLMNILRPQSLADRNFSPLRLIGRLRPGVTELQAKADLGIIAARLAAANPKGGGPDSVGLERGMRFITIPMNAKTIAATTPVLFGFGMVLLIACTNVANLLLARGVTRQQEIGVRLTLGASRGRMFRQLLTENLLLCLVAAAVGLALAAWALQLLRPLVLGFLPPDWAFEARPWAFLSLTPDYRVAGFTVLLALVAAVGAGVLPALQAARADLVSSLKNDGSAFGRKLTQARLRNFLVVAQVAVCLMLLSCAGLLVRNMIALRNPDLGFDPGAVFQVRVNSKAPLPQGDQQARNAFWRDAVEQLRTLPGVASAALVQWGPMLGGPVTRVNLPKSDGGPAVMQGRYGFVTAGFIETFGLHLLRGHSFTAEEVMADRRFVVISESAAARFWPGQEAVGRFLSLREDLFASTTKAGDDYQREFQVIGVVSDVRSTLFTPEQEFLYLPHAPGIALSGRVCLRPRSDTRAMLAEIVGQAAAGLRLDFDRRLSANIEEQRLPFIGLSALSGLLAGLALLMASIGLYGVMAFSVNQRVCEIGIRAALGATARDIVGLFVWQGVRLIAAGIVVGLGAGIGFTLLLPRLLFGGAGAFDPLTFGVVTLVFGTVALLACWLPARRAAKVDPMIALRAE